MTSFLHFEIWYNLKIFSFAPVSKYYSQDRAINYIDLINLHLAMRLFDYIVNNINICDKCFDNRLQHPNGVYIFGC